MSKARMKNRTLMLILIPIMAVVLVGMIVGNYYALIWNTVISRHFNQQTYRTELIDESVEIDDEWFKKDYATEAELTAASGKVAQDIEAEGLVLLKNDGALPIATSAANKAKVSLFSVSSVDMVYGGTGSGSIDASTAPTLKDALEKSNVSVNDELWSFYKAKNETYKRSSPNWRGGQFAINEVPWSEMTDGVKNSFANFNDAAIVVIARSGGEGSDLTAQNFGETKNVEGNKGSYLELSVQEAEMLEEVNKAFSEIIVLINANNAMELGWLNDYPNIKAAMWIGGVGQTGLYAVAEAIVGTVNPSGRLVDTYAYDADSAPAAVNAGANFWIENKPASAGYANEADQYIMEAEGIYVGYRYYETRYEDVVLARNNVGAFDYAKTVMYPFGYGLSYTEFEYSDFAVERSGENFTVSVKVTNKGTKAGKHTVQVYGQSEYTQYDIDNKIEKAAVELMGFAKTAMLEPNASETVKVSVAKKQFACYDYTNAKTYVLDAGTHYITVGKDAHDAVNNILAAKGKKSENGMTADGNASMAYSWKQNSLDKKTYSEDDKTETEITNRFDKANIQNFSDGKDCEYLSRNDWNGTYPTAFADRTDEKGEKYKTFSAEMIAALAPPYTEDKESFTMPTVAASKVKGLNLATLMGIDYDSDAWDDFLDQLTAEQMLKLVRMNGYGNPEDPDLGVPATVAKDGPAGISATLVGGARGMAYPTEVVIASTFNTELAEKMGVAVGNDALYAGVDAWYAPAMNIHRNAYAGRNFEYYSEDPFISGKIGAAEVKGAQSKGLFCYVKHFALNDTEGVIDATNGIKGSKDGVSTFNNEQAVREIYLRPFEYAVKEGGATGIMNAFNRIGTVWCGHHSGLQQDVLRGEWGFIGGIITDNAGLPNYMDIKAGLQAGTDLWMNNNETRYLIDGYESDPQIMTYLRNATHNLLYTMVNSAAMNGLSPNSRIISIIPLWERWLIVLDVFVGLLIAAGVVWIVLRCLKHPDSKEE